MDLKKLKDIPPWDWPPDAAKMFLENLMDKQVPEADRLLAAELAGDISVIDERLIDALLSILRSDDESDDLRGMVAIALGPVLEDADINGFDDSDDTLIAEHTFHEIRDLLHTLFAEATVPGEVRRRILEASVRAPEDWHSGAVRSAYAGDDPLWRLTAVFCMRFIRGFEAQILEALQSDDPEIRCEAVCAAGNWEIYDAWPHIVALIRTAEIEKPLLLAAIEAVSSIRPEETAEVLEDLVDSEDPDIAEAVDEAIAMAAGFPIAGDDDDEFRH